MNDGFVERAIADQQMIAGEIAVALRDAQACRRIALRIEIDEQRAMAGGGERRGEIDRRGGLADSALLIRNGNTDHHR